MQGCHHQARRAKENSPVIDHWVRGSLCPKSHPGRKNPRQPGWLPSRSDQSSAAVSAASAGTVSVPGPIPPPATIHPITSNNPGNITFITMKPSKTSTPFILHLSAFIILQKPPKYHFLHFNPNSEAGNEIEKTRREPSAVGRVTPCAPRLPPAGAKFPWRRLPDPLSINIFLEFVVPASESGFNPAISTPRKPTTTQPASVAGIRHLGFVILSSFNLRHSSFPT